MTDLWHPHADAAALQRDGARGFVLVLAGGGYQRRMDFEGPEVADFLAARGIPAGHLDYAVAPARYPDALSQVLGTLERLRAEISGPVTVLGFSAGGHLAGCAATATQAECAQWGARPDGAALAYPAVSLVSRPHVGSRASLLGPDAPDELAASLSVERRVDAATCPLFVWHTMADASVPVDNSLGLLAAAHEHGVPAEGHLYAEGRHGLGLALQEPGPVAGWSALYLDWLARLGIGTPA